MWAPLIVNMHFLVGKDMGAFHLENRVSPQDGHLHAGPSPYLSNTRVRPPQEFYDASRQRNGRTSPLTNQNQLVIGQQEGGRESSIVHSLRQIQECVVKKNQLRFRGGSG